MTATSQPMSLVLDDGDLLVISNTTTQSTIKTTMSTLKTSEAASESSGIWM